MILAHTIGSGGPEIEFLILAAASVITGVILFVKKSAPRSAPVVLMLVGIGLVFGAFTINRAPSAGPTRVTIVDPTPGDKVPADKQITLRVAVNNQPTGSHLHVFVDGALEQMPRGLSPKIKLPRGVHEVTVELTAANHQSFDPRVTDTIELIAK
jgi:hypothetical protein